MEIINKILAWAKANLLLAIGILIGVIVLFFPKLLKGIFGTTRRRRRRPRVIRRSYSRRTRRRSLPSAPRTRRRSYTKGGKVKKPWQVKGSIAARRHMARIRRMR